MLDRESKDNIKKIKDAAEQIWGDMCQLGDLEIIEAPFSMFQMHMFLYNQFDILLTYDRSILGINIKNNEEYSNIRNFTNKEIKSGFESCIFENILFNFKILDEVLKKLN